MHEKRIKHILPILVVVLYHQFIQIHTLGKVHNTLSNSIHIQTHKRMTNEKLHAYKKIIHIQKRI